VTGALRERLEREQHVRDRAQKRARLTAMATEIRASLRPGSAEVALYDASGLPR
jgi:hypothetical protein